MRKFGTLGWQSFIMISHGRFRIQSRAQLDSGLTIPHLRQQAIGWNRQDAGQTVSHVQTARRSDGLRLSQAACGALNPSDTV